MYCKICDICRRNYDINNRIDKRGMRNYIAVKFLFGT